MELNCVQTMRKSKVYVHDTTLRPQNAEQLRENGERTVVEILYCTSISHGAQLLYVRTTGCPTRLRSHYFSGGGTTTWLSVFESISGEREGGSTTWLSVFLFFSGGFTTTASQFDTTADTHNYTRILHRRKLHGHINAQVLAHDFDPPPPRNMAQVHKRRVSH